MARSPEPVATEPTGPVASAGRADAAPNAATSNVDGPVEELWQTLVEVLGTLESPASALLCTADGFPVVGYGYCRADLVPAARLTGKMFVSRSQGPLGGSTAAVRTVELTSGLTQTVIASIPTPQGHHLLSITADGVSMPVLQAWTHQTADELRGLLTTQA